MKTSVLNWIIKINSMMGREMEPRPIRVRDTTTILRIGSLRVQRYRGRVVEFEDALNRNGSRFERESNVRRPSEQRVEDGRSRGVNLPPIFAAHLGRSENEQSLQSTLTFGYGDNQPSTNLGDGLKMPSHVGSYDGKGDPDNYLYLFEGSIRMQKWAMPIACHMFTYTLKDSARIWWHGK
ncbi:hypothetical protein Tco_0485588 [Tanacetum coccineum]